MQSRAKLCELPRLWHMGEWLQHIYEHCTALALAAAAAGGSGYLAVTVTGWHLLLLVVKVGCGA